MISNLSYLNFILFLLPFSVFGQNDQFNPPSQQVNLYGGTALNDAVDMNPVVSNKNDFVIHEVIQSNQVAANFNEQQSVSMPKNHMESFGSGGGGSLSGTEKLSLNLKRSKIRFDHTFRRIFHRSSKKKRANVSCFSWS